MCKGSFNGVSNVFQGSLQEVSRKSQECFEKVSRLFHESFKGGTMMIEFLRIFQWVSRAYIFFAETCNLPENYQQLYSIINSSIVTQCEK